MLVPKQVKGLLLNSSEDQEGIILEWLELPENADEYRLFRGGALAFPAADGPYNVQDTDTLTVKIRGGPLQTITLTGVTNGAATSSEIVAAIAASGVDLEADVSLNNSNRFIIRATGSGVGKMFELVGGTALSGLGLVEGYYWNREQTLYHQIATVAQTGNPTSQFEDRDGLPGDFYKIAAVNTTGPFNPGISELTGQYSLIKQLEYHIDDPVNKIVIYGKLVHADGSPVTNVSVNLSPPLGRIPSLNKNLRDSEFGISKVFRTVYTDEDGFFAMEALPDMTYRLRIESIDYDQLVKTTTTSQDFTDLNIDNVEAGLDIFI